MATPTTVNFTRSYPPVTQADIEIYEQELGVVFPKDYRDFLLATNGGIPSLRRFRFVDRPWVLTIDFFYAVKNHYSVSDLVYELEDLSSRMSGTLPEGFLVIGHDPADNKYLLGTKYEHLGQVWYWDIARLFPTSTSSGNTYWLADSFADFLSGLHL